MINRVAEVPDLVPLRRAIVSVADKTGLSDLTRALADSCQSITLFATGNSYAFLKDALPQEARRGATGDPGAAADRTRPDPASGSGPSALAIRSATAPGIRLESISDYTGQPEMQGGLVKTLDYKIYLGLLSEPGNAAHDADLARVGAVAFDLVVCNLYPFETIVAGGKGVDATGHGGTKLEDARAYIDIGGVTLLRAAAKNFLRVAVLCDPADYREAAEELSRNRGALSLAFRFRLARKAFDRTSSYDGAIARYLRSAPDGEALSTYTLLGGQG